MLKEPHAGEQSSGAHRHLPLTRLCARGKGRAGSRGEGADGTGRLRRASAGGTGRRLQQRQGPVSHRSRNCCARIAQAQGDNAGSDQAVETGGRRRRQAGLRRTRRLVFPSRHLLGAALLNAGKAKDAEAVYLADLRKHPANGWALFGLAQALKAQKRDADAAKAEEQFKAAWSQADVTLTASAL